MKSDLAIEFSDFICDGEFSYGYIQPGHGVKGQQVSIVENKDLVMMYEVYKKRKQIILWLKLAKHPIEDIEQKTAKKPRLEEKSGVRSKSNHEAHLEKMSQVEIILDKLESIHDAGQYTPEQMRAWAHLLQMKKHDSYESPPNKPFFKTNIDAGKVDCSLEGSSLSPGKRLQYRSECINQLEKWHNLMERGAISEDEFKEMQQTILTDIKKF